MHSFLWLSNVCAVLSSSVYPTLCDSMDCSPPSSSIPDDSPDKNTRVGCHALLQGIFPTLVLNPVLPHCRQILYHLIHQGSPSVSYSCSNSTFLDRISLVTHQPRLHYIFLGNHQYLFSFIGLLITKHPQSRWLTTQKCVVSYFWRLSV